MKTIYTLFAAAAIAGISSATAQQLANNGFEGAWSTATPYTSSTAKAVTIGENPESWVISHVTGTTGSFMNGTGKAALGSKVAGYNSSAAVELKNTSTGALGITRNVPGYLTTGTTWSTAVSTSKTDGGTFGSIAFTNRPDAVSAMYKRTYGAENTENATVVVYLWKGQWVQKDVPAAIVISGNPNKINMVDRDRCVLGYSLEGCQGGEITETGELIGKVIYYIEGAQEDWAEVVVPIEYVSDATPEKFNIIFSANDYFTTTVGKDNTLTVDDVKLLYYSRLAELKYNGASVPGFAPDVYNYDLTSIQMPDDASKVATTLMGTSGVAKATTSVDAANNRILVTVTNPQGNDVDGKNQHVYTLQFAAKTVAVTSITLDNTTLTLKPSETATLTATVLPANATDKTVTWTTDNSLVAQVKDGVVTAVNPGETTITAACAGLKATCTVVVESDEPDPVFPSEATVFKGKLVIEMMGGQINEGDINNYYVLLTPADGSNAQARVSTTTYNMSLPNFALDLGEGPVPMGDINIDNVICTTDDDGSNVYTGSKDGLELAGGEIVADVKCNGIETPDHDLKMIIPVTWKMDEETEIPIDVTFNGKRIQTGTGVESVSVDSNNAPVEYFDLQGRRLNNPTNGIVIRRQGSKVEKVIL